MRIHLILLACVLSHWARAHDEVTPNPKLLQNGIPLRKLAGEREEGQVFMLTVPPGARDLVIKTRGGAGDADLYVRHNAYPTTFRFDQVSQNFGNRETIRIESPEPGPWYILVEAVDDFISLDLTASYRIAPGSLPVPKFIPGPGVYAGKASFRLGGKVPGATLRYTLDGTEPTQDSPAYSGRIELTTDAQVRVKSFRKNGTAGPEASGQFFTVPAGEVTTLLSGAPVHHRAGAKGSSHLFKISVPPDQPLLQFHIEAGTGETRVFVEHGAPPTSDSSNKAIRNGARNLSLRLPNPAPGDWYIEVKGLTAFAGYSVLGMVRPPKADLIVWQPSLDPYLDTDTFTAEDCEVKEGLTTPGTHRFLRFTTETRNIGGADMILPTPEERPDLFEFQDCHGHYHFLGFANYRLLDSIGEEVAAGRKVSFCLLDTDQWDESSNPLRRYECDFQGIQAGWYDAYKAGLPGQWIDVTGLPAGTYTLEVTMNPDQIIDEADYTNNTTTLQVEIPAE